MRVNYGICNNKDCYYGAMACDWSCKLYTCLKHSEKSIQKMKFYTCGQHNSNDITKSNRGISDQIKEIIDDLVQPNYIMSDASKAMFNSIKIHFPAAQCLMCYFHVRMNIRKHKHLIQKEKYKQVMKEIQRLHYQRDEGSFRLLLQQILHTWENDGLEQFVAYFKKQWINSRFSKWQLTQAVEPEFDKIDTQPLINTKRPRGRPRGRTSKASKALINDLAVGNSSRPKRSCKNK